jgi:2-oxoglutarate dehydrogenase complex, dehydrogenase (E1) component, and related enzymes
MNIEDFGPNTGLVEELYRQWQEDPEAVSESWRDFFEDYVPPGGNGGRTAAPAAVEAPPPAEEEPPSPAKEEAPTPSPAPPAADGVKPIRGAAARIVENMEASLGVPTATSARVIPAACSRSTGGWRTTT